MQVLNLMREFEMQKIKETKNMKDYIDKLPSIINNGDC
jgi:ferritin